MSRVILSRPAPLPEPYVSPWPGLTVLWKGWDGSTWDLTSRESGVALFLAGVEGLHFPKFTRHTSRSRAIPGNRLRGWHAEEREVFWPMLLWADGSDAWLEKNTAFMHSLHPDRPGTWTIRAGGAVARTLDLTLVVDDTYAFAVDPLRRGWAEYPIALEAAQPYWRGAEVVAGPWEAANPQDFFGAGGPPFTISESESFGTASAVNPGDIEAWGVWTVVGPMTGVELGVGASVIDLPFTVNDGQTLVIDTDPRHPTAKLGATVDDMTQFDGADVTRDLGLQSYAPIPDGGEATLHVQGTGAGSVQFAFTPLFFRAF